MIRFITAALVALTLSSCVTEKVRDEALVPSAQLLWASVEKDVDRGIADAVEDGDLEDRTDLDAEVQRISDVLDAGASRADMGGLSWYLLRPYAERGIQDRIDDGEIHELVAPSLLERVANFTFLVERLSQVVMITPVGNDRAFIRSSTTNTPAGREVTFSHD